MLKKISELLKSKTEDDKSVVVSSIAIQGKRDSGRRRPRIGNFTIFGKTKDVITSFIAKFDKYIQFSNAERRVAKNGYEYNVMFGYDKDGVVAEHDKLMKFQRNTMSTGVVKTESMGFCKFFVVMICIIIVIILLIKMI